jgi:hypothetical protein
MKKANLKIITKEDNRLEEIKLFIEKTCDKDTLVEWDVKSEKPEEGNMKIIGEFIF